MSNRAELIMAGVGVVALCGVMVLALFATTTVAVGVTVLRALDDDAPDAVSVARVVPDLPAPATLEPIEAAPDPVAKPVVPAPPQARRSTTRRRPASSVRSASLGSLGGASDDVLTVSVSQLRGLLAGSRPAPVEPSPSPVVPRRVAPVEEPPTPPVAAPLTAAASRPVVTPTTPPAPRPVAPRRPVAPPPPVAPAPAPVVRSGALVVDGGLPLLDPVRVQVTGPGLSLEVDGEEVGALPLTLLVEAGSHDLVLVGEGLRTAFRVNASSGDGFCYGVRGKAIKPVRCR